MGRRFVRISVVLLLLVPGLVAAQQPPVTPAPGPEETPAPTTPAPPPAPPKPKAPASPADVVPLLTPITPPPPAEPPPPPLPVTPFGPAEPTVLSEPVAPVPVIPAAVPPVEGAPPPPTISSAPLRVLPTVIGLGANRPLFVFQPTLSLSEEYTDNFNLTKTDRQSNFRTSIAPGGLFSFNNAITNATIGYTFSANHDSFQDEWLYFYSVLGQVSWQATPRLRLTLSGAFTRNDEPSQADSLNLRRERATFTSNTLGVTSDYTIGTVATREYYRWDTFNNGGNAGGSDTTTQAVGASASVPVHSENTLTLGYEYLTSHTSNCCNQTSSTTTQGDQDVSGYQVTGSFGRKINTLLTAGVSGSYSRRDVSGSGVATPGIFQLWTATLFGTYGAGTTPLSFTGRIGLTGLIDESGQSRGPDLTLGATATYAFARAAVSLALEHGFSETFATGENFGVVETTGASASLSYAFTSRTSAVVSAYYRKTETTGIGGGQSINGGPNIGSGGADTDESVGASALFTISLLRWLKLNLSYTYTQRFDTGNGGPSSSAFNSSVGYTENRGRISLDMSF